MFAKFANAKSDPPIREVCYDIVKSLKFMYFIILY